MRRKRALSSRSLALHDARSRQLERGHMHEFQARHARELVIVERGDGSLKAQAGGRDNEVIVANGLALRCQFRPETRMVAGFAQT